MKNHQINIDIPIPDWMPEWEFEIVIPNWFAIRVARIIVWFWRLANRIRSAISSNKNQRENSK